MTIVYGEWSRREKARRRLERLARWAAYYTVCQVRGHVPVRRQGVGYIGDHGRFPASHYCNRCWRDNWDWKMRW